MQRLREFFHLPSAERGLLVKAGFTVVAIRLGLWVLPFHSLRILLPRLARTTTEARKADPDSVDRVVWAVTVVSKYVPRATCLTQALAARVLLSRQGCQAQLTIGVAKSQEGHLEAHAWVESQGRIVIGGLVDVSRFTPLSSLYGDRL